MKPPSQRYRHYQHPSEEEHRTYEQHNWRDTKALNVGIALAAIVAAIFAVLTYAQVKRQADVAQDSLFASDRPWIEVQKVNIKRLSLDSESSSVFADVQIRNAGHSPAINLFVNTSLFPLDYAWEEGFAPSVAKICDQARRGRQLPTRQTIFPEEGSPKTPATAPAFALLTTEEINQARKDEIARAFERTRRSLGLEAAEKEKREDEAREVSTRLLLTGCVTYLSYRGLIGQSGFSVVISKKEVVAFGGGNSIEIDGGFIIGGSGNVPIDDIHSAAVPGDAYVR